MIRFLSTRILVNLIPPLLILAGVSNHAVSTTAQAALIASAIILALISTASGLSAKNIGIVALMGLIFIYFSLRVDDYTALNDLFYVGLCFALSSAVLLSSKLQDLSFNRNLAIPVCILGFSVSIVYPDAFSNSNYLAAAIGCISLPVILHTKSNRIIYLAILSVILFYLASRSVFLAFLSASFCFYVAKEKRKSALIVCITSTCIFLFAGTAFYNAISDNYYYYNQMSLELTGKQIESGRLDIWRTILAGRSIEEWVFGSSRRAIFYSSFSNTLSPHSLYVYTLAKYGLVGLSFLLTLIVAIYVRLYRNAMPISLAMVTFFLVRDGFELTLIANYFSLASIFWLLAVSGGLDPHDRTKVIT